MASLRPAETFRTAPIGALYNMFTFLGCSKKVRPHFYHRTVVKGFFFAPKCQKKTASADIRAAIEDAQALFSGHLPAVPNSGSLSESHIICRQFLLFSGATPAAFPSSHG